MRTGIIGTGRIGSTLARILVAAGHQVVLANARGPRSLAPLLAELGPGAAAGRPVEAAGQADLLVLMVPFATVRGGGPPPHGQDQVVVGAPHTLKGPRGPP
ncbi:NAD(P)-binding domain-containing protein, partial [Streptomyces lavendulae]|uniref:NAD(P)-binding domain-containing protein n=1 Tax=Streptomyces lavendulae TaxID=1914 RepID=UPI0036ABCA8D